MLRDLGLGDAQWVKRETMEYKMVHIRHIMDMFPDLKFILIGDSGQHDPEIYQKVLGEYPDRVFAIYIRHVADDERKEEIMEIAKSVSPPMVVVRNSDDALAHLKHEGLIS